MMKDGVSRNMQRTANHIEREHFVRVLRMRATHRLLHRLTRLLTPSLPLLLLVLVLELSFLTVHSPTFHLVSFALLLGNLYLLFHLLFQSPCICVRHDHSYLL